MEIIGTVKTILPMQEGVSSKGNAYKKLTVVITYDEKYPKDLAFTLFNTKIDELAPLILGASQENKPMKFFIDVTSREYNGKWYTEATCWKAESLQQSAPMPGAMPGGFPPQGYPQQPSPQGYPQQGYPQQGYPQQGFPPQGFPPQGQQPYLSPNDPFASAPTYAGPTNESPF